MYIALDLETTGFDPVSDDPIEVAAIRFDENQIYDTFQTLVNPGRAIPEIVTHITGIQDKDVVGAPTLQSMKQQILDFIGDYPIVGHNITFDTTFLRNKGFDLKNPEFDTLPLTNMIYPKLPSYSLETISAAFGIAEKQDHRALSDTVACAKLFQKILKKIQTLSPEMQKTIQGVFHLNAPHVANLFQNGKIGGAYEEEPVLIKEQKNLITSEREKEIEEVIYGAIEKKEMLLLEAGIGNGKYNGLAKAILRHHDKTKEKTLISVGSTHLQEILFHNVFPDFQKGNSGNDIVLVKEMQKYLSPERLKSYMSKENISFEEACFMTKIYIWNSYSENGEQDEISFTGEEFRKWEMVNINPWRCDIKNEPYLQKAYKKEENARVLVCYHRALAKEIMSPTNHLKGIKNLVVCEAHLFEKHVLNATAKTLSLDYMLEKNNIPSDITQTLEFFFGMLSVLFKKFTDQPFETLVIQNSHKQTKEWNQIRDLYKGLVEHLKNIFDENPATYGELLEELSVIEGLFSDSGSGPAATIFQNHEEQIRLRYMPIETMDTLWGKDFFQEQTSRIFISSTMRVAKSFDYIRDRLRIEESAREYVVPINPAIAKRLKVIIPSSLPDQEKPDYMMHANALMQNIVKQTPGRTIAIFSSKRILHLAYYAQATNLKNENIQLLAQDFSGGRGKIIEKYIADSQHMALYGTLAFLEKLELTKLPCENLIFQKIPFDPPSDPTIQMQANRYMDSFTQYALPETIIRFLGMLNQFLKNPLSGPRNLFIFDNRLLKKKYGQTFIDSMPEGVEIGETM
ncbi:MAG: exonuclease domain-containing protein [Candidatus Gracilibacteria bacterium]